MEQRTVDMCESDFCGALSGHEDSSTGEWENRRMRMIYITWLINKEGGVRTLVKEFMPYTDRELIREMCQF